MNYGVALTEDIDRQLREHLLRRDRQEDLCLAIWQPSRGTDRITALLREVVLPRRGERQVHGNASFAPHYFERALGLALERKGGLALLHSHPMGTGWQGMSRDDIAAESGHAGAALGATGLPLVGLTLAGLDNAWSARAWIRSEARRYYPTSCDSVRVAGRRLSLWIPETTGQPSIRIELDRTLTAWGERTQRRIYALTVGIIGLGSVGSIVSEALARMGVGRLVLIDFDRAEPANRDRVLNLYDADAHARAFKVEVAARAAERAATSPDFKVTAVPYSIVEPTGFRAALDCDLLFSCVDRPWPRSVLNLIAYAHVIPVVDGGIRLEPAPGGGVRRGDIRAHAVGPERPCLECLGQFSAEDAALERDGYLDDPTYIEGLPPQHHLRARQNVFAFSLMASALEVLQMLSMMVSPIGLEHGAKAYHFVPGMLDHVDTECRPGCLYRKWTALGDNAPVIVTTRHAAAEVARSEQE